MSYCTSGALLAKAGRNVNSTAATSAALISQFMNEADAFINVATRHNWVSSAPTSAYSSVLSDASSCLAAIPMITYDMSGYTGRGEAESMVNVLFDRAIKIINLLKDEKVKDTIT